MLLLYNTAIRLYFFAIYIASLFSKKAKLWLTGRKEQRLIRSADSIWFHFASLGEFEQGRPVLEQMRSLHPSKKIIITFFSPSGYEVKKDTPLADAVYYLPLDTKKNAREFIDAIQPAMVIFTKYEYWYHFFKETRDRDIPLYIISGIFRPDQIFFKWYGNLHRQILRFVSCFFVQDEASRQLLQSIGMNGVIISGDTRFDRVWANSLQSKQLPLMEQFISGHKVFIAGSTWPEDEKLLAALVTQYPAWKFIFAPHEIDDEKINNLLHLLPQGSAIRYSELAANNQPPGTYQTLIVDNIGMLSSLYQYGDIAYIGGGFGAGIHNTLEAAAFGLPVIFGPNYAKFKEAKDLIALKAGFSVNGESQLKDIAGTLMNDAQFYSEAARKASEYIKDHTGATKTIVGYIESGV